MGSILSWGRTRSPLNLDAPGAAIGHSSRLPTPLAVAGVLLGTGGWVIALAWLLLDAGRMDLFRRLVPTAAAVALAMAAVLVGTAAHVMEALARGERRALALLGAELCALGGLLMLLLTHWIGPQLAAHPGLAARVGGPLGFGTGLTTAVLLLAVVLAVASLPGRE